jgi:hypothetical protein
MFCWKGTAKTIIREIDLCGPIGHNNKRESTPWSRRRRAAGHRWRSWSRMRGRRSGWGRTGGGRIVYYNTGDLHSKFIDQTNGLLIVCRRFVLNLGTNKLNRGKREREGNQKRNTSSSTTFAGRPLCVRYAVRITKSPMIYSLPCSYQTDTQDRLSYQERDGRKSERDGRRSERASEAEEGTNL